MDCNSQKFPSEHFGLAVAKLHSSLSMMVPVSTIAAVNEEVKKVSDNKK